MPLSAVPTSEMTDNSSHFTTERCLPSGVNNRRAGNVPGPASSVITPIVAILHSSGRCPTQAVVSLHEQGCQGVSEGDVPRRHKSR